MLILLPPSETKRDGGAPGSALELAALSFPELTPQRKAVVRAVKTLSRNLKASTGALGLGPTQRFEIDRNRVLESSPVMPAIDRYTGVLYDGLGAESLDAPARAFLAGTTVIHSALFGLLAALDPIPAYRLSHNSRLPGLSLKKVWRGPVAAVLAGAEAAGNGSHGLLIDLRSESYVGLGPAPAAPNSVYLRVVSELPGGKRKALTHFNKQAKGEFVRSLAQSGENHADVESLLAWASEKGMRLGRGAPGELELVA